MNAVSSILTQGGTIIIDHQMFKGVDQGEVIINGTLKAGPGSISITGQGTASNLIASDCQGGIIQTTRTGAGSGLITLTGTGYSGAPTVCYGVRLNSGSISANEGAISITGFGGGDGTLDGNDGIKLNIGAGSIASTGIGTNAAPIDLIGICGGGTAGNSGIYFGPAGQWDLSSVEGDITLAGTGNGAATLGDGVTFVIGSITSTGTGADAATITLRGVSSAGTNTNRGIVLGGSSSTLDFFSTDGDIIFNGTSFGTGANNNFGVNFADVTLQVIASGEANISVNAIGGGGSDGFFFTSGGFVPPIQTLNGNISLTGTAGPSGTNGLNLSNGNITCTGTGNISLQSLLGDTFIRNQITTASGSVSILALNSTANIVVNTIMGSSDISCGGNFIAAANNSFSNLAGSVINISGNGAIIVDEQSGTAIGPGSFANSGTINSLSNNLAIYAVQGPMEPVGVAPFIPQVNFGNLGPAIETWDAAILLPVPLNAKYSTSYQAGGVYHGPGYGTVYTPGNGVFGSIVVWYKQFALPQTSADVPPTTVVTLPAVQEALSLIGVNTLVYSPQYYLLHPFVPCPILPCLTILCSDETIPIPECNNREKTE